MPQNESSEQMIRDKVDKILAGREFKTAGEGNPIADMIRRLWDSFREWIERILSRNRPTEREFQFNPDFFDSGFVNILKIVLIIAAVIIAFILLRIIVSRVYLARKSKKSRVPEAYDYLDNPDSAINRMKDLLDRKEYAEALRYLFIAVLLELNKRQIIVIEKWKTNRVYLREINSKNQHIAAKMKEFSFLFHACRYGDRMADELQINKWFDFYRGLKEACNEG